MSNRPPMRPNCMTCGLKRIPGWMLRDSYEPPQVRPLSGTPRRRRGYSLIETLATFSLMSLLAIASVGILNSITQNGIDFAHARQSRRDAQRMADTLRDDAGKTINANIPTKQWPVTLEHDNSTTVYDWNSAENILTRTETAEENKLRTERFLLPRDSEPRMTIDQSRLTLLIDLPDKHNPWVIEGSLTRRGTSQ